MLIATHDGSFHADETTACAIISYLYDNCTFIRSRDPQELEKADIILDVSGINDERHFDHHSKEFTLERANGIKYATAGLMWKKFGIEFLKKVAKNNFEETPKEEILHKAFERIDKEFMQLVDLDDNGQLTDHLDNLTKAASARENSIKDCLCDFMQSIPSIPYLVAMMNVIKPNADAQDKNFLSVVKILKTLLVNVAIHAIDTENGIAKVIEVYTGGELLIMHEKLPWTQAVFANMELFKDCLLAVYPDRSGRWRVQSLPISKAQKFKNRLSAPCEWRGLNNEDLDKATGLEHTCFIHKTGFTGGALYFEDNLQLAKLWLKLGKKD